MHFTFNYIRWINRQDNFEEVTYSPLSHREVMVLRLLSEGLPNKVIGNELNIRERTVEAHVRNIL